MSRYFFIGGFLGFALLFFISITADANIHVILRNSMVGCIAFALLFRFYFSRIGELYVDGRFRMIEQQLREQRERERSQQ